MNTVKNKKEKAITLIALVITIIVLLVIAGISVNLLLGENGILGKSKVAKNLEEKNDASEIINLKITNVEIEMFAKEQRMPNLKELADNFCEDDDFEKVIDKTEVASLTKITNMNPESIIVKLKNYSYEFEIDKTLRLSSIDGEKINNNSEELGYNFVQLKTKKIQVINSEKAQLTLVLEDIYNDYEDYINDIRFYKVSSNGTELIGNGKSKECTTEVKIGEELKFAAMIKYTENPYLISLKISNIESITVNDITIKKGEKKDDYFTISPSNADKSEIIFSSENNNIATVNEQGVVQGMNIGTTKIFLNYNNTQVICNVTVQDWDLSTYTNAGQYLSGNNNTEKMNRCKQLFSNKNGSIANSIYFYSWANQKVWFQTYKDTPVSITKVSISAHANDSGYEPIKDFYITGCDSIDFNDEVTIYEGQCTNSGGGQFTFESKGEFKFYRLYITSWWSYNKGDGQNIYYCILE